MGRKTVAVCSAHLPYDSQNHVPSKIFEDLLRYCEIENRYPVLWCNCNAQHNVWNSTNCNSRCKALVEFQNSSNLENLNQGNKPAFCSGGWLEVIDIIVGHFGHRKSIRGSRFLQSPPCRNIDIFCSLYCVPYS